MTRQQGLKTIPCQFFLRGTCRFGQECELKHDVIVSSPPYASDNSGGAATHSKEANECGICFDECVKYGVLSGCNHIFCFSCIMEWRVEGSDEVNSRRVCPTCRKESDYVVQSRILPKSDEEKQELLRSYKDRLARIPCRKWEGELGSCPFGSDCFYAHLDHDGKDIKASDQTMHQLYEERQRHRDNRRDEMAYDMISELIMSMGIDRGLIERGGSRRRRSQRDGDGNDEDDSDEEGRVQFEQVINSMFNHFFHTEHMRHVEMFDDSELEDQESDSDDSSMPDLEDVPRHGDRVRVPHLPQSPQRCEEESDDNDSNWESLCEESESDDNSMPELDDLPARRN